MTGISFPTMYLSATVAQAMQSVAGSGGKLAAAAHVYTTTGINLSLQLSAQELAALKSYDAPAANASDDTPGIKFQTTPRHITFSQVRNPACAVYRCFSTLCRGGNAKRIVGASDRLSSAQMQAQRRHMPSLCAACT